MPAAGPVMPMTHIDPNEFEPPRADVIEYAQGAHSDLDTQLPAFFEEFLMRGGVLGSYMSTGRVRAGVLLSALVFGLMHMNATQFFYATIIGIVLGLLYALTGSIWPGVLFHLLNNGVNTFAQLMDQKGYGNVIDIVYPIFRGFSDPLHTVILVGAALIGLPLAWLCLRRIARGVEARLVLHASRIGMGSRPGRILLVVRHRFLLSPSG